MEKLILRLKQVTNKETNAQRFELSPEKEKEMFLSNVMGRMNHTMTQDQSAYNREDKIFVKETEIGPTVERLQRQQRLENQSYEKHQ